MAHFSAASLPFLTLKGITRPSGTLFREEGLALLTKQSNAPYPLSPIPYPKTTSPTPLYSCIS